MAETTASTYVYVDGKVVCVGLNVGGTVIAPIREIAEALGATIAWDPKRGVVISPKA